RISYQHVQVAIYPTSQTKTTEGQNIYFSGKNIPLNNGAVEVLFNNVKANILLQAKSLLQVKVPPLPGKQASVTIVVKVNGKEFTVANNIQYQRLVESPPDLCGLVTVSFKSSPKGIFGGKRNVDVIVINNSKYSMDIAAEIFFIYARGANKTEELPVTIVDASSSKAASTVIQGKDIKIDSIRVTIKSIRTKEFGVQKCK
ncbi:MAG: IPT/TIG domain-containing protein, partial [Bacteroidota bacterium]|nr:IPT/TIG domain-containing protein [Bacteroidota bacterium]